MTSEASQRFDPVFESVRAARRFVITCLKDHDEDTVADGALLVSELATNAVMHAGTRYTVTVVTTGDCVRVSVADEGVAMPQRRHYGEHATTGRGLAMVEEASASWGVDPTSAGKVVWFELRTEKGPPAETSAASQAPESRWTSTRFS